MNKFSKVTMSGTPSMDYVDLQTSLSKFFDQISVDNSTNVGTLWKCKRNSISDFSISREGVFLLFRQYSTIPSDLIIEIQKRDIISMFQERISSYRDDGCDSLTSKCLTWLGSRLGRVFLEVGCSQQNLEPDRRGSYRHSSYPNVGWMAKFRSEIVNCYQSRTNRSTYWRETKVKE